MAPSCATPSPLARPAAIITTLLCHLCHHRFHFTLQLPSLLLSFAGNTTATDLRYHRRCPHIRLALPPSPLACDAIALASASTITAHACAPPHLFCCSSALRS
ncbi:hypothetical protein U1Q18_014651 [Sarracenia purpurea var. burkii]